MNALLGVRTGCVCVGPTLVAAMQPLLQARCPVGRGLGTLTQAQALLGRARDSHISAIRTSKKFLSSCSLLALVAE